MSGLGPIRLLSVIGSSDLGGAERSLVSVLEALPRDRFDLRVACPGSGVMREEYRRVAAEVREFCFDPAAGLLAVPALTAWMRDFRPHVVHTHLWTADFAGGLAAAMARVPVRVASVRGSYFRADDVTGMHRTRRMLVSTLYRAVYRLSHAVVAVSAATASDLSERSGLRVPAGRITVIHPGIDSEAVRAAASRQWLKPDRADPVWPRPLLVCVANLVPIKDHASLLNAMLHVREHWPGAHLLLVGEGHCRAQIERHIGELGLEVHTTLVGERRDAPRLMAAADVVVLSSRSEGTPRSLLEALCLERPVVATAVGGVTEVLRDRESGRLVPPGDPVALAAAISDVLAKPEEAAARARRGRIRVEQHYSAGVSADRTLELYRRLLASRKQPY